MRLVRLLPDRVKALAPEALRFGAVGLGNTVLYFAIFNLAMGIGAVKATVLATVITTTLSYLANRHWTYKSRPKSDLRREYTLFFAFNLAGMLIQAGVVFIGKYGVGLSESEDRIAFNLATCVGIGLATMFRFWAYRTLVFRPAPVAAPTPTATPDPAAAPTPAAVPSATTAPLPRNGGAAGIGAPGASGVPVDAAATADLDAEFATVEDAIDAELASELAAADAARTGRPVGA